MKRVALMVALLVTPVTEAARLKDGFPACFTERHLEEITRMLGNGNARGAYPLLARRQCVDTRASVGIVVVKAGLTTSTVRAYYPQNTVELHVPSKAITDER